MFGSLFTVVAPVPGLCCGVCSASRSLLCYRKAREPITSTNSSSRPAAVFFFLFLCFYFIVDSPLKPPPAFCQQAALRGRVSSDFQTREQKGHVWIVSVYCLCANVFNVPVSLLVIKQRATPLLGLLKWVKWVRALLMPGVLTKDIAAVCSRRR